MRTAEIVAVELAEAAAQLVRARGELERLRALAGEARAEREGALLPAFEGDAEASERLGELTTRLRMIERDGEDAEAVTRMLDGKVAALRSELEAAQYSERRAALLADLDAIQKTARKWDRTLDQFATVTGELDDALARAYHEFARLGVPNDGVAFLLRRGGIACIGAKLRGTWNALPYAPSAMPLEDAVAALQSAVERAPVPEATPAVRRAA